MKEYKDVHGSQEHVDGIEFNVDTIYIRTNIKREKKVDEITQKDHEYWVYDEVQYSHNEYLEILNTKVDKSNIEQETLILDNAYRVAVLEISTGATLNI